MGLMKEKKQETPGVPQVETYEEYIKRTRKRGALSFEKVAALCFACVLLCAALLGWRQNTVAAGADTGLTLAPTAPPTPSPTPVTPTPAPTDTLGVAMPMAEETTVPQYVRTAVYVEGKLQGVLVSEQAALELMEEIKRYYAQLVAEQAGVSVSEVQAQIQSEVYYAEAEEGALLLTGDELFATLIGKKSPLKVLCQVQWEETEAIPYETETKKDKYLVTGTRIVEQMGRDGEKTTRVTESYINGEKQKKAETEVISQTESMTEILRIGTDKQTNTSKADKSEGRTGPDTSLSFISPIDGSATANYGQIKGVLHLGLDYTPNTQDALVLASCAGTVVCAMERGGYGLMVEIDHGEGFVTRYACLGAIAVAVGDWVEAGQIIGTLTGENAFLHFELRINGEAYNPRYYINK